MNQKYDNLNEAIERRTRINASDFMVRSAERAQELSQEILEITAELVEELAAVNEGMFVERRRGDDLVNEAKKKLVEAILQHEDGEPCIQSDLFRVRYVKAHKRKKWNTDALIGYSVACPDVLKFLIETETAARCSITIKDKVKK